MSAENSDHEDGDAAVPMVLATPTKQLNQSGVLESPLKKRKS